MLGNFSLLTNLSNMSSLFLMGQGSSRSDSKQAQGAGMKLIQHLYNDNVASLCWNCFSSLCFLDSNYIHKFRVYSCIYHFNRFSFSYDACGVSPLFPSNFCMLLLELVISHFLLVSIITVYSLLLW